MYCVDLHEDNRQYVIAHKGKRLVINNKDTWRSVSGARSALNWQAKWAAKNVMFKFLRDGGLEPGPEPDWKALEQQLKHWATVNLDIIEEHVWNATQ